MIPIELYYAAPYMAAFLLAGLIPVAATLQYRITRAVAPDTRLMALMGVIALGALLTVALTPRSLDERDVAAVGKRLASDFEDGFAASRYLTLFVVGAGFVEMLRGWINSRKVALSDPARPVWIGIVTFYFGTIAIQALVSEHPDFSYKSLYVPIVLLAVYYQRVTHLQRVLEVAKAAVLGLMLASLAAMFIKPDFVMLRPAGSVIPGIDFRLFGLSPHANALGPVALIGLLLELYSPSAWRVVRAVQLVACLAVLVLAQSKTAWVAAVLIMVLVAVPLGLMPAAAMRHPERRFGRAVFTLLACIGPIVVACIGLAIIDSFGNLDRAVQVDTLTGRTMIWSITLQAWQENLLFGYGREIWGAERMMQLGLLHVGQAHNQFVQTLGEAGLVGLVLLLTFLLTLLYASLRCFVASRGITFALLIVVLARCVTEAPLRSDGVLSWPSFTIVLLVMLACHFLRAGRAGRSGRSEQSHAR